MAARPGSGSAACVLFHRGDAGEAAVTLGGTARATAPEATAERRTFPDVVVDVDHLDRAGGAGGDGCRCRPGVGQVGQVVCGHAGSHRLARRGGRMVSKVGVTAA